MRQANQQARHRTSHPVSKRPSRIRPAPWRRLPVRLRACRQYPRRLRQRGYVRFWYCRSFCCHHPYPSGSREHLAVAEPSQSRSLRFARLATRMNPAARSCAFRALSGVMTRGFGRSVVRKRGRSVFPVLCRPVHQGAVWNEQGEPSRSHARTCPFSIRLASAKRLLCISPFSMRKVVVSAHKIVTHSSFPEYSAEHQFSGHLLEIRK